MDLSVSAHDIFKAHEIFKLSVTLLDFILFLSQCWRSRCSLFKASRKELVSIVVLMLLSNNMSGNESPY